MSRFYRCILYGAIIFLFYALYGKLCGILELGYPTFGYNYAINGFIISGLLLLTNKTSTKNSLFCPLLIFTAIGAFSCLLNYTNSISSFIESIICISTPIIAYFMGINISMLQSTGKGNPLQLMWNVFFALEIICVLALFKDPKSLVLHRDFVFCLIFFIPIVALIKNKAIGTLLFVIAVVIMMISIKRSAILGIVGSSLVFITISFLLNGTMTLKKKTLTIFIVIPLIIGTVMYYINTNTTNQILARFENVESDGGSGRDQIYTTISTSIDQSNFFDYCFGHGYEAVSDNLFNHPAHNDLLEIGYDYGVSSLCAWLVVICAILVDVIKSIKKRIYYLGGLYLASFVLWQIVCETNCIFLNTPYNATIFLLFGIISNDIKRNEFKIPKGTHIVRSV